MNIQTNQLKDSVSAKNLTKKTTKKKFKKIRQIKIKTYKDRVKIQNKSRNKTQNEAKI